jgi:Fur family transcriptional regulator, ferric uptake regulator
MGSTNTSSPASIQRKPARSGAWPAITTPSFAGERSIVGAVDDALRDRWLAEAGRRMAAAGLRAGAARTAVVELLAREGQCLVSVQELSDRLRGGAAGSPASVYRTVDELFGLGLLHRVDGRDGVARFEIADDDGHHHHFVDDLSGEVRSFEDEPLERAIERVAERLGLALSGHEVILRGRPRRPDP